MQTNWNHILRIDEDDGAQKHQIMSNQMYQQQFRKEIKFLGRQISITFPIEFPNDSNEEQNDANGRHFTRNV